MEKKSRRLLFFALFIALSVQCSFAQTAIRIGQFLYQKQIFAISNGYYDSNNIYHSGISSSTNAMQLYVDPTLNNNLSGTVTVPDNVTYSGATYRVEQLGTFVFMDATKMVLL